MKYLLIFLLVLLVAWKWRSTRSADLIISRKKRQQKAPSPIEMVQCAHCGVHVPEKDMAIGKHGVYCGDAHLKQAES